MSAPIGKICIEEEQGAITRLYVVDTKENEMTSFMADEKPKTRILVSAVSQLSEYFEGKRKTFDLSVNPYGTEFQKKVWQALVRIPYGETKSYGEIAAEVGNPKAARAVGSANNKNPILLLIPCHRVVGTDGSLTGFACGLTIKEYLLNLEKDNKETRHQ
jgi:methylated-DNA-[protein]-cysteine S-methyltransferase